MRLVVVESPTKAKTISKFLGSEYKVEASFGHVRDLPQKTLGIDIEHDFQPKYVVIQKAKQKISELKNKAQKSKVVILGTDEDREGESIAWHLVKALNLDEQKVERIVFHEITQGAIEEALRNPRGLDMKLVNAQQARRILDRLVGYKLSPFLWKKIAAGLSAGRVQSVAVRLIVEREREIENFMPQEYWTIAAQLKSKGNEFEAILIKKNVKVIPKLGIQTRSDVEEILKDLEGAQYRVANIEKKETFRLPLPPFTTSTLQQTAWQRFRFPAKLTMRFAQNLYERGFITYHRTDSVHLAAQAVFIAQELVKKLYGLEYGLATPRTYKTKSKLAQEAHEAIRPTYPEKKPEDLQSKSLDSREWKLYDLIWRRFIACQMQAARFDSTTIEIEAIRQLATDGFGPPANRYGFRATGLIMKFDGFLKVYPLKFEEMDLPPLEKNEPIELLKLIPTQHFTKPPQRFNDASLVKTLEQYGIGRPSTYAPIIDTILQRNYIERDQERRFFPTDIGKLVNDVLVEHFPEIVDVNFTATMEDGLDNVARGTTNWVGLLRDFYTPFSQHLAQKYTEVSTQKILEKTGEQCPSCQEGKLVIRIGRFGKFAACSRFPACTYTRPVLESIGIHCPTCKEGEIVERFSKKHKKFYGCSRYPECDFALWDKPSGNVCDVCGSIMVMGIRKKIFCSNKECRKSR